MWKGYYIFGDRTVKLLLQDLQCDPEDGIMESDGSDDHAGHFVLSGVISKSRKVKFFLSYDNGETRYFSGMMKSDFKLISGSWGMNPEDNEDVFRLQKSTTGVVGSFTTKPAAEEKKQAPAIQNFQQSSIESIEMTKAK